MYIEAKNLTIKKDISEIDLSNVKNDRSRIVFDFAHEMTSKFESEGLKLNEVMDQILAFSQFEFEIEFDRIIFKTLLNEYVKLMNITATNLPEICVNGIKRFMESDIGKISNDVNKVMLERLETMPQLFLTSAHRTKENLLLFTLKHYSNLGIVLQFNDEFLKNQVLESAKRISAAKEANYPKGGCYIATMAYGDYNHPQVMILRQFRDEVLDKSAFGKWFIKTYYHNSPRLVQRLKNQRTVNILIRKALNQFIKLIK
jgi:hypothetical protein